LDQGIESDDRLSILETLEALRCVISWRAVTVLPTGEVIPRHVVIYTPEVTPDGKARISFRGSPSALDRAFTLLTEINE
jgi:hypothetical protein